MKKTFATSAIATIAAVNLIFSAPIANAATVYTVDHVAESGGLYMTGGNVSEFDGKAIVKRSGESYVRHLFASDRSTDSTVDLTAEMVSDGRYFLGGERIETSVQFDGKFWDWVADDAEGNYDLLYSDGSQAGTGVIEIDREGIWDSYMVADADGIYFVGDDGSNPNADLYFFDGSTTTDMNVTDNGANSFPFMLRTFQGKVSFLTFNNVDEEVQQYTAVNGVETNVGEVLDMWNSDFDDWLPAVGDANASNAYAFTSNDSLEESYLWWTNDVDTVYEFVTDEFDNSGAFFDGAYYFGGGFVVGSYAGLSSAVGNVVSENHDFVYPDGFVVLGDWMYFSAYADTNETNWNLYKMGTDGVVHLVLQDGGSNGAGIGDSYFFRHDGGTSDSELWVADPEGARLVSNILETGESEPDFFGVVGDEVCFGAFASTEVEAYDLYCVSGSALAETGVDAGAIGAAGVLTLIVGGGLAVVRRRSRITA